MLKKAIEMDPASDAADTARILLAQAYLELGQRGDSVSEIAGNPSPCAAE
jgi:hypothetical protein